MRTPNKSRSRNKNNRRNNNNNGGNVLNRVHDSAGPEGRVRGTPVQVIEKYQALAHDYSLAGDRVATENFQQHAEHYIRLINEAQRQIAERREQMENQNQNNPHNNARNPDQNNQSGSVQPQPQDGGEATADSSTPAKKDVKKRDQVAASPLDPVESIEPSDNGGGLVETPESSKVASEKPKRSRAPRKPKNVEEMAPPSAEG